MAFIPKVSELSQPEIWDKAKSEHISMLTKADFVVKSAFVHALGLGTIDSVALERLIAKRTELLMYSAILREGPIRTNWAALRNGC